MDPIESAGHGMEAPVGCGRQALRYVIEEQGEPMVRFAVEGL
jgi:hypothetical protein